MEKIGVMICGHGSRDPEAVAEFERMARVLARRLPDREVASGYLEFARPTIREGLDALAGRGVKRIFALPAMLFAAGHVKNDIPWELNTFAAGNPGIEIRCARDLAIDARLLAAARARIEEAESQAPAAVPREDTLLLVVGRGTNDPDSNSNISKIARMLWEGMGFGWAEAAFSGVAHPRVEAGLERAVRLGFSRIVVFPYFLFTGVLVKRIFAETDAVASRHPEVSFLKAQYLSDHPLVIETFAGRLAEILKGQNLMNCQLCKYREQVIGYEADQGKPQAGHHHHVRGIGTIMAITATITTTTIMAITATRRARTARRSGAFAAAIRTDRPGWRAMADYICDPSEIYRQSLAAIRGETDLSRVPPDMVAVALRLVHACAIPEIVPDLVWSPGAAEAGRGALQDGAPILCDGEMTANGIIRGLLPRGNEVICTVNEAEAKTIALERKTTRSAAAVELWRGRIAGSVVAVGTAPTALFRLLEIIEETSERPALVLGFPVGFIGAAESKEALGRNPFAVPFIALKGRKGGSALAAAAVNALAAGFDAGDPR
jgi:sirohydrochlorin cobaltochelatase